MNKKDDFQKQQQQIEQNSLHAQLTISAPSIMVCAEPADLRKSIDGLAEIVMKDYKLDPYKNIFIFINGQRNKLKVLAWHNNGFIVLYKRLDKGKFFNIDRKSDSKKNKPISVTKDQLSWIIAGLDWVSMTQFGELEYKDFS